MKGLPPQGVLSYDQILWSGFTVCIIVDPDIDIYLPRIFSFFMHANIYDPYSNSSPKVLQRIIMIMFKFVTEGISRHWYKLILIQIHRRKDFHWN